MRYRVEYAIEAACLGLFMIVALAATIVLEHAASPVHAVLPNPLVRRVLMGLAMGLTVISIVYSPWGARSGAHLNPAVTLTFWRLGRVAHADAVAYAVAQFAGGLMGTWVGAAAFGAWATAPEVGLVATTPGRGGVAVAFAAEAAISFGLMLVVLHMSSNAKRASFTGLAAGAVVATWIAIEAPLSGMSMNPARTLGPALLSGHTTGLWIYFVAPPLGMLAAAEVFVRTPGVARVLCAKLNHAAGVPCPFICNYGETHS